MASIPIPDNKTFSEWVSAYQSEFPSELIPNSPISEKEWPSWVSDFYKANIDKNQVLAYNNRWADWVLEFIKAEAE